MPFRSCQVNDPWLVPYFLLPIEGAKPSRKSFVKRFDNDVDFGCVTTGTTVTDVTGG
jgi:hypothetical protein